MELQRGDPVPSGSDHDAVSLMRLPTELHLQLFSCLDFPSLQMLRATNSYFRALLSGTEIAVARKAYIWYLRDREIDEVANPNHHHHTVHDDPYSHGPRDTTDPFEYESYLTCYTCFRTRHITHYTRTQSTRRRKKGHADAHKRFCTDCALRDGRWAPGTILTPARHLSSSSSSSFLRTHRGLLPALQGRVPARGDGSGLVGQEVWPVW